MYITKDVKYIGVNDREIELFEGQYRVPDGITYNSYVIIDEKIAVTDTVDGRFAGEWLANLEKTLEGRKPDYLVIHHMEPDHSANIVEFMTAYPEAKIVSSDKAFKMMSDFFGTDFADRRIVVKEGDTLSLGRHSLTFFAAPMVLWPEVMVSYDAEDKILFSADGFGKFGISDDDWACEARRYYFGIVGKYGMQVQALLKKADGLNIEKICPLHGPVLTENLGKYIGLYDTWSSYRAESEGVLIAYTSVYGNTKKAVGLLADALTKKGCKVVVSDLATTDLSEVLEDAFRYDRLVLATTTYNADIFPFMKDFLNRLVEHGFKNRTIGLIENGSWAPIAAKKMKDELATCKDLVFCDTVVKILSAVKDENVEQIEKLAEELTR